MSEREIPRNEICERHVLGGLLDRKGSDLAVCQELFPTSEVFYYPKYRLVYDAVCKLALEGQPISELTVSILLREQGHGEIMPANEVLKLGFESPPEGIEFYAKVVRDKWRLRKTLDALRLSAEKIFTVADDDVGKCLDEVEATVLAASVDPAGGQAERIAAPLGRVMAQLDDYRRGVGVVSGVRTGFSYLDKMIGGLHPGEMCVLAGRPSTGKTSLAANIIDRAATEDNIPVALFSLEMGNDDIALRMICARAGASFHKIRTGFMKDEDHKNLVQEAAAFVKANIWMDDTPALNITSMRTRARRLWQQHGIKLIVIDYLQLAQAEGESDVQMITAISQGCKSIARELNVPVLVLSQLNRESEREKKRKPMLSDLRGSGSIEQDADLVMLLYRCMPENEEEEDAQEISQTWNVNVYVAKQRNGPTGDAELIFEREFMRFADAHGGRGKRQ